VTNCFLTDEAWLQAALPVRWGGLEARSISSLVSAAFLASVASAKALVTTIFPPKGAIPQFNLVALAEADWLERGGSLYQVPSQATSQKAWDNVLCNSQFEALVASGSKPVGLDFCLVVQTLQAAGCQPSLWQAWDYVWGMP